MNKIMHLTKCEETILRHVLQKLLKENWMKCRQNLLLEFQKPYLRIIHLTLCDVS